MNKRIIGVLVQLEMEMILIGVKQRDLRLHASWSKLPISLVVLLRDFLPPPEIITKTDFPYVVHVSSLLRVVQ